MTKNKSWIGLFAVFVISIIPVILWVAQKPLNLRFVDKMSTLTSFGQLSSLVGMTLFALVLIIGARLKFLEEYFSGLNRMYIDHHRLGGYALIFLMFHPLFLAAKYIYGSSYSAAQFLLPSINDFPKSLGIYGLALMMLLLVITFYASWRYDIWKLSHKFLVLAFAIGFYHMLLIPSDTTTNILLRDYLILISVLALIVIIYRAILSSLLVRKLNYELVDISPLKDNVYELVLKPLGDQLKFSPGQFAFISFHQKGFSSEAHPFSVVSHPNDGHLAFAAKALGDYTKNLGSLKVGARADIEGPFGRFAKEVSQIREQIWIAGGIGITPFISMAQDLRPEQKVDLYYTVKDQSETIYLEALQVISQKNPNFRVFRHISNSQGRLTAGMVAKQSANCQNCDIFLCGPPAMMYSMRAQFIALNIKNSKIHSEEFSL